VTSSALTRQLPPDERGLPDLISCPPHAVTWLDCVYHRPATGAWQAPVAGLGLELGELEANIYLLIQPVTGGCRSHSVSSQLSCTAAGPHLAV
jgi:hypothetical protein